VGIDLEAERRVIRDWSLIVLPFEEAFSNKYPF
jgi:hypothetical protein